MGAWTKIEGDRITIRALLGDRQAQRMGEAADYERLCAEIASELRTES